MIVKKLAVPLINDKLLLQAEHCYIATAAISEEGFDFVRSRIPPKCKMEIVTGLDVLTSPQALRRIWRNYQDRITLNIFTKNFFHPSVYIFDLPFRKAVAFIGSGAFTLGGIKDNEEIFYKITDAKEIENLKSWFIGCGPDAELELIGTLGLDVDEFGSASGLLTTDSGLEVAVVGQINGRAINLAFDLGDDVYIFGLGTSVEAIGAESCGLSLGGPFVGPDPADTGTWLAGRALEKIQAAAE